MRIQGGWAALVTPLTSTGELHTEALAQLVDRVAAGGVDGVSTLGSTGECATLSPALRLRMVKETVRLCTDRVVVAAGISDSSPEACVEQINACAEAGAAVALVTPPFYFQLNQEEVKRFYEELTRRSDLPVVLYNIPHLTKIWIEPATVAYLVKDPKIIAVKDSSRSFDYTQNLVSLRRPEHPFAIMTGSDTQLIAALTIGADGAWAASMNVAPELTTGIIRAQRGGDLTTAFFLHRQLMALVALGRRGTFPAGWKALVELIGIPVGPPAWPTMPLSVAEVADLQVQLDQIKALKHG
jgi:4-hydroxy-tetrahydrodipicolinate synthase